MDYKKSLFIFRRDLRLDDNTGLLAAAKQSQTVIPCFIFDPAQVGDTNEFRSTNCIQFMIESLQDLQEQLKKHNGKLYLFFGKADDVIKKLIAQESIDAVFVNRDYTPYSLKRDQAIEQLCHYYKIEFESHDDLLLNSPESIKTGNGTPYGVFTAFWKRSIKEPVAEPINFKKTNFYTQSIDLEESDLIFKKILPKKNPKIGILGGRQESAKILKHISDFTNYLKTRDIPELKTSRLSAYIKFGTHSIREIYHQFANALGKNHPLIKQLYWRDFFTQVAYYSPFVFGHSYHKQYDSLPWSYDKKQFTAWCEGKTGFPIVDAGMRELNATGFMHNRVRMIVASFLTKDLHINWLLGEKYFAQQLVDYDPCVNNGNWQWSASTGYDAQPYFRIFNPWLQQSKFDPHCEYIKQWVPELKKAPIKTIHDWYKTKENISGYPRPIVDHAKESALSKIMYKQTKNSSYKI